MNRIIQKGHLNNTHLSVIEQALGRTMAFVLIVFSSLQLTACDWEIKEPVEVVKSYPLAPGTNLNLYTSGGSITVNGEEGLESAIVEYKIYNYKDAHPLTDEEIEVLFENLNIQVNEKDDELSIRYEKDINLIGSSTTVSFSVRVPVETMTMMRTSGGSLRLKNLNANAEMRTSGGSIRIEQVEGDVAANTSGGSIRAEKMKGNLNVSTSGGSLRFTDCEGSIEGKTSGGSIRLINATNFSKIDLRTSGGSITLDGVSLENVALEAKGSRVRFSPIENFSGTIKKDYVSGSFGEGNIPITLRTSGGSVRINED
jgi:hypothetical protein